MHNPEYHFNKQLYDFLATAGTFGGLVMTAGEALLDSGPDANSEGAEQIINILSGLATKALLALPEGSRLSVYADVEKELEERASSGATILQFPSATVEEQVA